MPGFSKLKQYSPTSPATDDYNCIAWAAEDTERWWWPDNPEDFFTSYWPDGIPREASVDAFVAAFSLLGYGAANNTGRENGYQKVAIYARDGLVKHMARQLESGKWTSKLGHSIDIEHDALTDLEGNTGAEYGALVAVLKRPLHPKS